MRKRNRADAWHHFGQRDHLAAVLTGPGVIAFAGPQLVEFQHRGEQSRRTGDLVSVGSWRLEAVLVVPSDRHANAERRRLIFLSPARAESCSLLALTFS